MTVTRKDCAAAILEALTAKGAKEHEIREIGKNVKAIIAQLGDDALRSEKFGKLMDEQLAELRLLKASAKRAAVTNMLKRAKAVEFLSQEAFAKSPKNGLAAIFGGGTVHYSEGGNLSVMTDRGGISGLLQGMLSKGLAGMEEFAAKGQLDREFFQAMDHMVNGTALPDGFNKYAMQMAKTVRAVDDEMLRLAQREGAPIEKLEGRLAKRTHSPEKIQKAGFEKWSDAMLRSMSDKLTENFPGLSNEQIKSRLKDTYDNIVLGRYGRAIDPMSGSDQFITNYGLSQDIGKKISRQRAFTFNNWEAEYKYNQEFGRGTVIETLNHQIMNTARDVAIMRRFGTNPEGFKEGIIRRAKALFPEHAKDIDVHKSYLDAIFNNAIGVTDTPGTGQVARVTQNLKSVEYMSKMVNALLSSWQDLAGSAGLLKSFDGSNLIGNAFELSREYLKHFANKDAARSGARELWFFLEDLHGEISAQYGGPTAEPGKMARAVRFYGKMSLIERHVLAAKNAMGAVISRRLGAYADIAFNQLEPRIQEGLKRYSIAEHEWDTIRRSVQNISEFTGRPQELMITPESVRSLPRDAVEASALKSGQVPGKPGSRVYEEWVDRHHLDLQLKVNALIAEHANMGSTTANIRNRTFMNLGTKDENFGSLLRLVTQFQSAALSAVDVNRRILLSNPATKPTTVGEALFKGKGDLNNFAQTAAFGVFIAAMAKAAKSTANNESLPDPMDRKTWMELIGKSQMGSLYSDYFLGEYHRNVGSGVGYRLLGPVISDVASAVDIMRMAETEKTKSQQVIDESVRLVLKQVPNLFYTKYALDYLMLNGIREFMNGGYLDRMENNLYNQTGPDGSSRHYIFPGISPTNSVRLR